MSSRLLAEPKDGGFSQGDDYVWALRCKFCDECVQPINVAFPAEQFDYCGPAVFVSERT